MSDTPETDKAEYEWREGWSKSTGREEMASIARKMERERNEAIETARTAIGAIEMIYGHAQFCDECQSFEIAKQCRDELHGFDRINSLEND